jgi:nicotinamidase-related amidase
MLDDRSALLVIDVQQGFRDPDWGARNNPQAEERIADLIAAWRANEWPVMHVAHSSTSERGHFRIGTAGHQQMQQAAPADGEPVYLKTVNSAFIGTSLEVDLRCRAIDKLVVVGLTTNHCVSTTARMAGNLGFETYVVSDATATFERMGLDGAMRPAADVHAAALSDLDEEFAAVVNSEWVLQRCDHGHPTRTA